MHITKHIVGFIQHPEKVCRGLLLFPLITIVSIHTNIYIYITSISRAVHHTTELPKTMLLRLWAKGGWGEYNNNTIIKTTKVSEACVRPGHTHSH